MNVIFISVRTGSSRFPQKAIKKINGKATIEHLIERLKESKYAEKVILCTTELQEDDILCDIARKNNIEFFRGSSPDKLSRWLGATEKYNVDFFVNVDGDDIFFDAGLADVCFKQYLETNIDFIDGRGFYNDVYGMKTSALKLVCDSKDSNETEFIKPFFEKESRIKIEKIQNVPEKYEKKKMRLTLDYEEDFLFLKNVIENNENMSFDNILLYLENNPEVIQLNWHREQDWIDNQKDKFKYEK